MGTDDLQRSCAHCLYFREEEYTGYCQLHQMYVLKTFDCSKFVRRSMVTAAGGVDGKREESCIKS